MIPVADEIIGSAKVYTNAAAAALAASQQRTRAIITGVGIAAVLIGLGFSWLIGRSIARPLNGLADVMKRLADGDMSARIPATRASDEIGAMARTVIVFRDNMIERDRLTADQTKSARDKEQRSESVAGAIAAFRDSIQQALGNLRGTAQQLEMSSTKLNGAADAVTAESRTAESRVNAASQNVTSAASSVEELAASIGEIAGQAAKSTEVAAPRRLRGAAHRADDDRARRRRDPHRRGDRADPGDRRPDQPARAQRHHRGGARRRGRPRLRGGRLRGEVARRPDRARHRGDRRADRRHPVRRRRFRAGDRAGQRHHHRDVRHRLHGLHHRRGAERGGVVDRRRRQPRLDRGADRRRRP